MMGRPPDKPVCNWRVGIVTCTRPALILIERAQFGNLLICATHMDIPDIYAEVQRNGWKWRVVGPARE
jgi:hypothetical protein